LNLIAKRANEVSRFHQIRPSSRKRLLVAFAGVAYGLALDGVDGIVHVLRSILAEADLLMAVDGYPTIKSLREAGLIRTGPN